MAEIKQESVVKMDSSEVKGITQFLELALKSVDEGIDNVMAKGTSVRFSKDYCNSIVEALKIKPEFKGKSDSEIKLALQPLFSAIVLNTIAKYLQVVVE